MAKRKSKLTTQKYTSKQSKQKRDERRAAASAKAAVAASQPSGSQPSGSQPSGGLPSASQPPGSQLQFSQPPAYQSSEGLPSAGQTSSSQPPEGSSDIVETMDDDCMASQDFGQDIAEQSSQSRLLADQFSENPGQIVEGASSSAIHETKTRHTGRGLPPTRPSPPCHKEVQVKPETQDKGTSVCDFLTAVCIGVSPNEQTREVILSSTPPGESAEATNWHPNNVIVSVSSRWVETRTPDEVSLSILAAKHEDSSSLIVQKSICVSRGGLQVFVHGIPIKNNHVIWADMGDDNTGDGSGSAISKLAARVEDMSVCQGAGERSCEGLWNEGIFGKRGFVENSFQMSPVYRSHSCHLLVDSLVPMCCACRGEQTNMIKMLKKRERQALKQRDISKINFRFIPAVEMANALREARSLNSKYKKTIALLQGKLKALITSHGEDVSKGWSNEFTHINKSNFEKMSPIQKLFWDEQLKAASLAKKTSMRWHPMMIRLALHFAMVSPSAYENVRDSGFLVLPSKRTLYDYSHAIEAKEGIQEEIVHDVTKEMEKKCKEDHERYFALLTDEMDIRSNLVYKSETGELVGYVKLTEVESEFENLKAQMSGSTEVKRPLAKKVLAFLIKSITVNEKTRIIKAIVAIYSVSTLTAGGLFQRSWEVIYHLESADIFILCQVFDGCAVNRRYIKLNPKYGKADILHATVNLASKDIRPLFFILDPVHLIKTLRNSFANSYRHKKTRTLWRKGEDISWQVIVDLYEKHRRDKFRKSMLTAAHVYLNSHSLMKTKYATQIFSKTVAQDIETIAKMAEEDGRDHPPVKQLVKFITVANDFTDCMNGHNVTSHKRFKNKKLKPYSSLKDKRFKFFKSVIRYFEEWEKSVNERTGRFTKKQRKKMLVADQTVSGIKITCLSFVEVMKFLIRKGAKEICGRRVCQDPLEQTFSTFRMKGGSSNNPDLATVLQTRISLHAQKQVALPSKRGNTKVTREEIVIDDTPVPKRKK